MNVLNEKALKGESLDDGTFVAYLMLQNKLTPEQIYGNVSEIMPASVDTVSMTCSYVIRSSGI